MTHTEATRARAALDRLGKTLEQADDLLTPIPEYWPSAFLKAQEDLKIIAEVLQRGI